MKAILCSDLKLLAILIHPLELDGEVYLIGLVQPGPLGHGPYQKRSWLQVGQLRVGLQLTDKEVGSLEEGLDFPALL